MPNPKPGRKSNGREFDSRLQRVAELYLQRTPQYQIAERLNVTASQISYDLKVLRKRWRQSAIVDFTERVGEELAVIDRLEAEAWAGWAASRGMAETRFDEAYELPGPVDQKTGLRVLTKVSKARVSRMTQAGDPRFLAVILNCVAKRCELLGLVDPVKLLAKSNEQKHAADPPKYTDTEFLTELLASLAEGGTGQAGGSAADSET